MTKFTKWFTKDKPYRVGVYQRVMGWDIVYSYWDGNKWFLSAELPKCALLWYEKGITSMRQSNKWRGIAK